MDRYLVIHEYTCPVCNGDRYLYDERWTEAMAAHDAAYNSTFQRLNGATLDEGQELDEEAIWAVRHAATDAALKAMGDYWAEHGYHWERNPPPEEYPCTRCEGAGTIREEVDLATAIEAIHQAERR